MAYLDPAEAFAHFRDRTVEGIQSHFPIKGKLQTLHLEKVEVKDDLHPDDLRSQHKAKVEGGSYAVPVFGQLKLVDNMTGKVVDSRRIRLAEIPKQTQRYSYILDGQEYQIDNQWQLKPGAYTRRRQNGELETRFNVANKTPFDMVFDPGSKQLFIEYNKAKLPAYPLLKTMGVDDDTMAKMLGKDILEANKNARGVAGTLEKFYKTDRRETAPSREHAEKHLYESFTASKMRPEATALTLGKPIDHVNGEALLLGAKKLLQVQSGHPEDDRDSLTFKDLRSAGDFAFDKIRGASKVIAAKTARKINQATDIRDIVKFDLFNDPIKQTFHKNNAARVATQINPVEMVSSSLQTTIMGPGGIKSERSITDEAKFVNPSHFGFLDPIATPEGNKTGVTLRLPLGVRKVGHEPKIPLFNLKTNKTELVAPGDFVKKNVVLPDQVTWEGGKPKPIGSSVKLMGLNNEMKEGKFSDAQYVMRHTSQLFNMTSNLIPFLGNTSGNRASMASRHIEQAVSLLHRESPLVQVATGVDKVGMTSFEKVLGSQASHQSPIEGTVKQIKNDAIVIHGRDGKTREVHLYNNYPLNDAKSVIHSNPTVKVGDRVKAGQNIADTNYSKDGTVALGTNLRVGFIPFKGYNFEDGIVISESAAKKLSSVHLYKPVLGVDENTVLSRRKFEIHHPGLFKRDQIEHIGDDGLPKIGARVRPGDPLILAVKPFEIKDRTGVAAIRKNIMGTHTDKSLRWDGEGEGEVVGITKSKDGVHVHVKTVEIMQVGDKMCFDEATEVLTSRGWVPVASVTSQDFVCCLVDGSVQYQKPTALHAYPTGGRMYRIKSQQVDLLVTAEHKMYVQPRGKEDFRLLPAKDIFGKRVSYAKSGRWQGHDPEYISLPALKVKAGQYGRGTRTIPEVRLPVSTYMMLLGAFLSNGWYFNQPSSGSYGIAFSKCTGPAFDELCDALRDAGLHFTRSPDGNASKAILYSKQLSEHFKQFGHALDKFIPDHVFDFSRDSLVLLFQWLMWGDGTHAKNKRPVAYFTSSKQLADDVQRLCLHVGMAGNVNVKKRAGWYSVNGSMSWCETAYEVRIVTTKLTPQVNHGHVKRQKVQEEYWVEQYNRPVYCVTVPGHVLYVRRNGKSVWSGNSGRHGNKGIVSRILPDHEMPKTKAGHHIEVALNPSGVPGRMNVGQVLETASSKLAEKLGKPYIVPSFQRDADMVSHVQKELKKHGLSDQEEIIDPVTGQSLGHALVGKQYMLKLVHQVDKKVAVASGMGLPGQAATDKYDINLQPKSGQRVGSLGMYALLAHGAKANLREMQTWKGEGPDPQTNEAKRWPSQHNQVWKAIQTGEPLPTPKPTFAFKKFEDLLRGAGVNIEKRGHELLLSPLTDKHILELTGGRVLPKPGERLEAKIDKNTGELKPRPGGLFDEKLTGGHGGTKWSRIPLAEPVPNPIFEAPIRALTGLSQKDFNAIVAGEKGIHPHGHVAELGKGVFTGGHAIEHMLKQIDVKKELEKSTSALNRAKAADVDPLLKKVKYLRALEQIEMKPHEAYVLKNVPVIPPSMRPASLMQDGNIKYADINQLYSEFAQVNEQLKDPTITRNFTESRKSELRRNLYDGVRAIAGFGIPYKDAKHKGLLHTLSGASPKTSYFQKVLVQKRQDLTMRSVIVPEPALGLDEVGLPKQHALDLFRPFVVKKLQDMGAAPTPLDAQKLLAKKNNDSVWRALDKVMEERPVLLKRDPALHKYSVQGFQAKAVDGNAIKIHPLVCDGFNADHDGDTMSVFVPISREAVNEAHRMKPTENLFAESSGRVAYSPTLESALGIYKLSITGKDTGKKFSNPGALLDAVRSKKGNYDDVVSLNGKKTTAGRVLLAHALPEAMRSDVLHNLDHRLDKKGLNGLLTRLGKDHKADFDHSVNKLKDLGNDTSFGSVTLNLPGSGVQNITDPKKNIFIPIGTHSLGLADFAADKTVRNSVLSKAHAEVAALSGKGLTSVEKDHRTIDIFHKADKEMQVLHEKKLEKNPTNLFHMYKAGVKPGWDQYKQMVLAPMLLRDSSDRIIPTPVTKSYGEGLDIGSYWTQMHGARRGSVLKVQEVQDPGYMSKLLMNNTMNLLVGNKDCGTTRGISMGVHERDIHDRVLAQDFNHGKIRVKAGTVLSPDITGQIKAVDKNAKLLVRSPLKCEHEKGLCQYCLGVGSHGDFHDLGTNAGVHAAQTVGERAVQLTLKSFHTGGVVEQTGGKLLSSFSRFEQLAMLPKKIPNAASLAMTSGKIDKIEATSTGTNVFINGKKHFVGKDAAGHALVKPLGSSDWKGVKVGQHVTSGTSLSDPGRTFVNPHDLYKATGSIDKVQNHLASEMYELYKDEGVKRRHVETVVKAMSNLTKVVHPGDAVGVLRGEFQPLSVIQKTNSDLVKAGRRPVEHTPVLKGVNMMPLSLQEDWMAKMQHQRLRTTVADAAAMGGRANVHGVHPIPALAYGAEVGLTSEHALRPGHGHLHKVPRHHY